MWAALGMAVMLLALGGCASRPVAPSAPGGPRSTGVGAAPRTSAPTAAPAATPGSAGPSTAS
ncbi:hypothetical protein J4N35_24280, partial [Escherichia fergusonii]|uniref:hypothetical protein n=1 Tax=Escherichia fergusonii TaxID=564 RepID=UPI001CBF037B